MSGQAVPVRRRRVVTSPLLHLSGCRSRGVARLQVNISPPDPGTRPTYEPRVVATRPSTAPGGIYMSEGDPGREIHDLTCALFGGRDRDYSVGGSSAIHRS